MGGNGSYYHRNNGVPVERRSHLDTHKHIDGHKILLQKASVKQSKNIMQSNSDSPIYLIAKTKGSEKYMSIQKVNVFEGHNLKYEVNLRFDKSGNLLGYNAQNHDAGSHTHIWEKGSDGRMHRVKDSNGKEIHMAIPKEYLSLINKVVRFNNKNVKYNG